MASDAPSPFLLTGRIVFGYNEDDETIKLEDSEDPDTPVIELVKEWKETIPKGTMYYCGWVLADQPITPQAVLDTVIASACGILDANYSYAWTSTTGHLWTTQELKIGGHDLVQLMTNNKGRYIYLIINGGPLGDLADLLGLGEE